MSKKNRIPHKFLPWIDARKKYRLTHAQVQMARELGLNPKKLGNLMPGEQQKWKLPMAQYLEQLYVDRFGRPEPEVVKSMEELAAEHLAKREAKKAAKVSGTHDTGANDIGAEDPADHGAAIDEDDSADTEEDLRS